MTPLQIRLVQDTSDVLLSVQPHVADRFYQRLFETAPETRDLFPEDLAGQKAKLTSMLATLIGSLHRPDVFSSIIKRVGQDHAQLGVKPAHYEITRIALHDALMVSLEARFTPDVQDAWAALYNKIREQMLERYPLDLNLGIPFDSGS